MYINFWFCICIKTIIPGNSVKFFWVTYDYFVSLTITLNSDTYSYCTRNINWWSYWLYMFIMFIMFIRGWISVECLRVRIVILWDIIEGHQSCLCTTLHTKIRHHRLISSSISPLSGRKITSELSSQVHHSTWNKTTTEPVYNIQYRELSCYHWTYCWSLIVFGQ